MTKKIVKRRNAFTLIEMMVVIAIILAVAALAAAFAPRVNENQNLTRAVDNFQQWLLTAKMRAKRDGLATGLRLVQAPGDAVNSIPTIPGPFSQVQYVQQPEPLTGGSLAFSPNPTGTSVPAPPPSAQWLNGSILLTTPNLAPLTLVPPIPTPPGIPAGYVQIYNFDPTLGGTPNANQWLVQSGDFLEINGGGVYFIQSVGDATLNIPPVGWYTPAPGIPPIPVATLKLGGTVSYYTSLTLLAPTLNFRILRQPRLLIGEEPLSLPNNYAVSFGPIPGVAPAQSGSNVLPGASGNYDIVFAPAGAIVGTNSGNTTVVVSIWDIPTQVQTPDPYRVGIVGVQCRTGFIGAYGVSLSNNAFLFVQMARESGL